MTAQAKPRPESLDDVFKRYAHAVVVDNVAPIDAFCVTIKAMDVPDDALTALLWQAFEFSCRAQNGEC